MATKKKTTSPVVFTGISRIPSTDLNLNTIPPYEDVGIAYKGYAKVDIGNGKYKLLRQDEWTGVIGYNWAASSAEGNSTPSGVNVSEKNFFMTKILITAVIDRNTEFRVYDNVTGNIYFRFDAITGVNNTFSLDLTGIPYLLKNAQISARPYDPASPSTPLAITGRLALTIYGFSEDKS